MKRKNFKKPFGTKEHQISPTSWEPVQQWYRKIVGEEGHYYHQHVVLPGLINLLNFEKNPETIRLLDLGCGNGVLAKTLPPQAYYTGIDISPSFIQEAKQRFSSKNFEFLVSDITKPLPLKNKKFTHATMVLCAQNLEHPEAAIKEASNYLEKDGVLVIVINHPIFRIPRQSSWEIDEEKKLQYRRIDRYMTSLKIPIQAHPGQRNSPMTFSFHYPLHQIIQWFAKAGLLIETLEEWCSDKQSIGKNAKMENRGREEFPLFMAIKARKIAN